MKFSIRNAELRDSNSIADLSHQLGYKSENAAMLKRLTGILDNDDNCILVALENEILVGWIHGFYSRRIESDSFIEIGGLIVDENYRKNGVGKMLVEEIIKWADFKKCKKVRVRSNTNRTDSHIFYQKLGYEINKEQKIFDRRIT